MRKYEQLLVLKALADLASDYAVTINTDPEYLIESALLDAAIQIKDMGLEGVKGKLLTYSKRLHRLAEYKPDRKIIIEE